MTEDDLRHRKRSIHRMHASNNTNSIPNESQRRSSCNRRKIDGLTCSICEGPAHGYNFDAITCESCKAFFRRNALKSNNVFKCRVNDGRCLINISTRKRCKACRLAKCFEKGMRADWILTDEERSNKKQKIEENRRLRQMLYPDSPEFNIEAKEEPYDIADDEDNDVLTSFFITPLTSSPISTLSSDDLLRIQQIQQAYIDSVRLTTLPSEIPSYPQSVRITEPTDMANLPANMQATRLISFFKLLPEFSILNDDDKLVLIKYNTFALVVVRAALNYNPATDTYHEPYTDDCVFSGRDLIQCFSLEQYQRATRCTLNLISASMNDRFVLQILLVILLLSKGSAICTSIDEMEPIAQNILSIYHVQNIFIDLLWKYCEHHFGYTKTIQILLKLTITSLDVHLHAFYTRRDYAKVDPIADQLTPLMKSVMLIS